MVADPALRPTSAKLAGLPREERAGAREELGRLLGLLPAPTPPRPAVGAVCGRCGQETEYSKVFLREEGGFLCDPCLAGRAFTVLLVFISLRPNNSKLIFAP